MKIALTFASVELVSMKGSLLLIENIHTSSSLALDFILFWNEISPTLSVSLICVAGEDETCLGDACLF